VTPSEARAHVGKPVLRVTPFGPERVRIRALCPKGQRAVIEARERVAYWTFPPTTNADLCEEVVPVSILRSDAA
jgi:hypothetical protein